MTVFLQQYDYAKRFSCSKCSLNDLRINRMGSRSSSSSSRTSGTSRRTAAAAMLKLQGPATAVLSHGTKLLAVLPWQPCPQRGPSLTELLTTAMALA